MFVYNSKYFIFNANSVYCKTAKIKGDKAKVYFEI